MTPNYSTNILLIEAPLPTLEAIKSTYHSNPGALQ